MTSDTIERTDELPAPGMGTSRTRRHRSERAVSSALLHRLRVRWAAIGAAIAVALGAGGFGLVSATVSNGERLTYVSIAPCRVIDLRPATTVGPRTSPLGPGETFTISAHGDNGNCVGIPTEAVALTTNITALNATARTFLTVWPSQTSQPNASSLNPWPGQSPAPNAVTTRLSPTGQFNVFNSVGSVNILVDVTGYYVDHDHDDRYDTSAEVNAKIAGAITENLADPEIGREVIDVGTYQMQPDNLAGFFINAFGSWQSDGPGTACLVFPLDLVPGQRMDSVSFTIRKGNAGNVSGTVALAGVETRPNDSTSIVQPFHSALFATLDLSGVSGARVEATTTESVGDDRIVRAGYAYYGRLCTNDPVVVYGGRVTLSNP